MGDVLEARVFFRARGLLYKSLYLLVIATAEFVMKSLGIGARVVVCCCSVVFTAIPPTRGFESDGQTFPGAGAAG